MEHQLHFIPIDALAELLRFGRDLRVEAKARAAGFAQLYVWLDGRDVLVVKADRREVLVVIPLRLAAAIAVQAEQGYRMGPVADEREPG